MTLTYSIPNIPFDCHQALNGFEYNGIWIIIPLNLESMQDINGYFDEWNGIEEWIKMGFPFKISQMFLQGTYYAKLTVSSIHNWISMHSGLE